MEHDDISTDRQQSGRALMADANGDTLDELETNALDQAREIFGPDARLEFKRNYNVHVTDPGSRLHPRKLWAYILVREIP